MFLKSFEDVYDKIPLKNAQQKVIQVLLPYILSFYVIYQELHTKIQLSPPLLVVNFA